MAGATAARSGASPAGAAASRPLDYVERVVRFGGEGTLVGILTEPIATSWTSRPTVLFVTAGMVHRVGPNRMYVTLSRQLASRGFRAVRFDLSGIGDSQHRSDGLPADESAVVETCQVMTALEAMDGANTYLLAGLCSGAVTAFRTALRDDRVVGALLLNPQGFHHDAEWNAQAQNRVQARKYVKSAMFSADNWRRALTGRIEYSRLWRVLASRLKGIVGRSGAASPIARALAQDFRALAARDARLLIVCCEGDSSLEYMSAILGQAGEWGSDSDALALRIFEKTDHSFTLGLSQRRLSDLVDAWTDRFGGQQTCRP